MRIFLSLTLLLTMFGCAGTATTTRGEEIPAAPDWADNPEAGCASGSAKNRGNRNLAKSASVSRARDELARQLQVKVQGMIKDYGAMGESEGADFNEELVSQVSRQVVDTTLVGTRTVKSEAVETEMFTLVCLDPETFADAFDKMESLSQKQRAALKSRAQAEFADLDAQLNKQAE